MANNRVVTELVVLNGDESEVEDNYSPVSATEPLPVRVIVGPDETPLLVDANGAVVSVGNVAAGATDSGHPVKVGGVYVTTKPTLTNNQRGNLPLDARGNVIAVLYSPDTANPISSGAGSDGLVNSANVMRVQNNGMRFNETTWDRERGNTAATGLASAARTASTPTADQTNYNGRGAQIILDVTATPNDAQTLQITIEGKDPVSGKYIQLAAFTALIGTTLGASPTAETYVYTVYPGSAETIATAKHELQALPLPRTWRVNVLHSAAGSWTYSVGLVNLV